MARIGLVVGNGLTLDLCSAPHVAAGLPDPRVPFAWDFKVPAPSGLPWRDAFPLLSGLIDEAKGRVNSFDQFEKLLALMAGQEQIHRTRTDTEARQFLVFAYSNFQQHADRAGYREWRWFHWLKKNRSNIKAAVSFNYDLVLEHAASAAGVKLVQHCLNMPQKRCLFFKPHGSVDLEVTPRAVRMPEPTYPLKTFVTLNDAGMIRLVGDQLLRGRRQASVVLPTETSSFLSHQWVSPAYQKWAQQARQLTHCLLVGLSYWRCDRREIDFLVDQLDPSATVVVVNPTPPEELIRRIEKSGRKAETWLHGPESL